MVIAVVALLAVLVSPLVQGLRSRDVRRAAQDLEGALQTARSHAIAHQTYVWVGIFEEDVSVPSEEPAEEGVGRLVIATVASRDGSSIYNKSAAAKEGASTQVLPPDRLTQVGTLVKINNAHVFKPESMSPRFDARPGAQIDDQHRVGLSPGSAPLLFQFQYPLGGTPQYVFGRRPAATAGGHQVPSAVIQFSPQGEAVSDAGPLLGGTPCLEIALQQTNGNTPAPGTNVAAVSISGITGQTSIYQP